VAGVTVVFALCRFCRVPVGFNKASVRGFLYRCRLVGGEDPSWLLAQPALHAKPTLLPVVVLILGTPAGRSFYLWHT
jgi:hypothetical protein